MVEPSRDRDRLLGKVTVCRWARDGLAMRSKAVVSRARLLPVNSCHAKLDKAHLVVATRKAPCSRIVSAELPTMRVSVPDCPGTTDRLWMLPHAPGRTTEVLDWPVAGDRPHVLGALEGGRVGAMNLAHTAAHLLHRLVFVLFHPADHFLLNLAYHGNTVLQ